MQNCSSRVLAVRGSMDNLLVRENVPRIKRDTAPRPHTNAVCTNISPRLALCRCSSDMSSNRLPLMYNIDDQMIQKYIIVELSVNSKSK